MGQTAENVASLRGVSRQRQDEWAVLSQQRTEAAIARGFYATDITPVELPDGTEVTHDDGPRPGCTYEKLSQLNPVFRSAGTVTAANCCPLNDGAASVVVMEEQRAQDLGVTPVARILSTAVSGLDPEIMGLGPVEATRKALAYARLTVQDLDLYEINEAFAAQVLPSMDDLGLDPDRLNVNGGGIALGHPFGATGARICTTLLHNLQERDATLGLETMCVGGGQGMAMIVERLS
ncbi:Serine--tRNA ligase [Platysternon megacephalum]|uniref:Serine--tRNA ligase n=1 Tax=Platysternon megacephalum TaxID=55544 RepID=A0A4D9DGT2_9SAUR|nr:Serine--tRNA ligase [Platysternon megacephalum]